MPNLLWNYETLATMLFNCTKYLEWARSFTLISGGRADGITTTIVTKNSIFGNFVGLRRYLLLCPVIMVSFWKNFCEIIRSLSHFAFFTILLKIFSPKIPWNQGNYIILTYISVFTSYFKLGRAFFFFFLLNVKRPVPFARIAMLLFDKIFSTFKDVRKTKNQFHSKNDFDGI